MSEAPAFPDFIRRIRAGDDRAARELVERYQRNPCSEAGKESEKKGLVDVIGVTWSQASQSDLARVGPTTRMALA
jgi:hypothetical protein